MRSLVLIALFVALVACSGAPEDKLPGIVDITAANANEILDGTKYVFVEFYAPWCGHCKNLAPEYAKVGEALEKVKPKDVIVAKVNCDEHRDVCGKYDVKGYPTLKFFGKSGTPEDYQKGRTADDIIEFLNDRTAVGIKVSKPVTAVTVLTPANFAEIALDSTKNVLVEFYAPWCGHCKRLDPDYEIVAKAFRLQKNVVVAKVDADKHRDLGEKYGVSGFPTIKFFPAKADKKVEDYNLGRAPEDFLKFLNEQANAKRTLTGMLDASAGRIAALDDIVSKFATGNKAELISQAEAISKKDGSEAADYYVRALKKTQESSSYASTESDRLQRVLDSGAVAEDRLDNMKIRLNILKAF